jgi:hypothetical protein
MTTRIDPVRLRAMVLLQDGGMTVAEVCKALRIGAATYFRYQEEIRCFKRAARDHLECCAETQP